MNRLIGVCSCCNVQVELLRDHISGPNHYRCGNCFEVYDPYEISQLAAVSDELKKLEEQRHAIFAKNRLDRVERV